MAPVRSKKTKQATEVICPKPANRQKVASRKCSLPSPVSPSEDQPKCAITTELYLVTTTTTVQLLNDAHAKQMLDRHTNAKTSHLFIEKYLPPPGYRQRSTAVVFINEVGRLGSLFIQTHHGAHYIAEGHALFIVHPSHEYVVRTSGYTVSGKRRHPVHRVQPQVKWPSEAKMTTKPSESRSDNQPPAEGIHWTEILDWSGPARVLQHADLFPKHRVQPDAESDVQQRPSVFKNTTDEEGEMPWSQPDSATIHMESEYPLPELPPSHRIDDTLVPVEEEDFTLRMATGGRSSVEDGLSWRLPLPTIPWETGQTYESLGMPTGLAV